jgi:hypothetical protein
VTSEPGADPKAAELRRQIEREREQLVNAVGALRETAGARRLTQAIEHRLPVVLAGAFLAGFVVSGGIGAAVRLVLRRGRDSKPHLRVGRFVIVER